MNSRNNKTSDTHGLLLNLTDKIDLRKNIYILVYQILALTVHGEI